MLQCECPSVHLVLLHLPAVVMFSFTFGAWDPWPMKMPLQKSLGKYGNFSMLLFVWAQANEVILPYCKYHQMPHLSASGSEDQASYWKHLAGRHCWWSAGFQAQRIGEAGSIAVDQSLLDLETGQWRCVFFFHLPKVACFPECCRFFLFLSPK